MSKNKIIFVLVLATLLGSIWGSIAHRERKELRGKLESATLEMERLSSQTTKEREQVLGKTAGLQETLAAKKQKLGLARKELVTLRKANKALEAQISGCNATITQLTGDKETLQQDLASAKQQLTTVSTADLAVESIPPVSEQPEDGRGIETVDTQLIQEQLLSAELAVEGLQQSLDAANAQIIGLEKIVDEKRAAMAETGQEMDRLKINMDVLLSKIADQQDDLQELRDENRELIKDLAAKNEELSDLMEEMVQQPVQE